MIYKFIYKKRAYLGFSLIEILIVLLIMSVIAAAIVPLLDPSKIKRQNDNVTSNHGAAECFYDNDGNLILWTIDNKDNKSGKSEILPGPSCEITVPKTNFYKMTAIGAGGSGIVYESFSPSFTDATQTISGKIRVDSNFSSDMDSAPDFIKEKWGTRYATYELISPTGKGGDGLSYFVQDKTYGSCSSCTVLNPALCPAECYSTRCASGGDSGFSKKMQVRAGISSSDIVKLGSYYEYVKLTISDKYIKLNSSGNGTNAYLSGNNYYNGNKGNNANYTITNGIDIIKDPETVGYNSGGTCSDGDEHTSGNIRITSPISGYFNYTYNVLAAKIKYNSKGELGEMKEVVYEKLSEKKLVLTPGSGPDVSSKIEAKNDNGNLINILEAKSGKNGETHNNTVETIQTSNDLPFPQSLISDVIVDYPSNYIVSTGFKSKIKDLNVTPGKAGYGIYPLIDKLGENVENRVQIQNSDGSWDTYNTKIDFVSTENLKCLSDEQELVKESQYYCKATYGSKGAVIISW